MRFEHLEAARHLAYRPVVVALVNVGGLAVGRGGWQLPPCFYKDFRELFFIVAPDLHRHALYFSAAVLKRPFENDGHDQPSWLLKNSS